MFVGGILALLDDNAPELQSYSLRKLNGPSGYKDVGNRSMLVVESFWHEIDDHLPRLETLYEDNNFPDRKLAALVASKVHFYLSSYDLAMTYALGAEDLFDITEKSSYVQKVCLFNSALLKIRFDVRILDDHNIEDYQISVIFDFFSLEIDNLSLSTCNYSW